MIDFIRKLFTKKEPQRLSCEAGAVLIDDDLLFSWTDVVSIEAYKIDEITTDLICLDFHLASGNTVTIHEELVGFNDFLESMQDSIKLSKTDWMSEVVQPPFKESRTKIYACL
ncbi:hypothetical protein [Aliiglaciecola litoralis]|uniref:Uncharacterized protein n=1 Tax=Aliiglaciecola litoralis TaxID=582857 RepID=A0ABP3X4Q2_9ALTE